MCQYPQVQKYPRGQNVLITPSCIILSKLYDYLDDIMNVTDVDLDKILAYKINVEIVPYIMYYTKPQTVKKHCVLVLMQQIVSIIFYPNEN